jgi:hypothetical protein
MAEVSTRPGTRSNGLLPLHLLYVVVTATHLRCLFTVRFAFHCLRDLLYTTYCRKNLIDIAFNKLDHGIHIISRIVPSIKNKIIQPRQKIPKKEKAEIYT